MDAAVHHQWPGSSEREREREWVRRPVCLRHGDVLDAQQKGELGVGGGGRAVISYRSTAAAPTTTQSKYVRTHARQIEPLFDWKRRPPLDT